MNRNAGTLDIGFCRKHRKFLSTHINIFRYVLKNKILIICLLYTYCSNKIVKIAEYCVYYIFISTFFAVQKI